MVKILRFYEPSDKKTYIYSNFYEPPSGFMIDGEKWISTEAYFQGMKFSGPYATKDSLEYAKYIRETNTSNKLFALGRQRKLGGYKAKWTLYKGKGRKINDIIDEYKHLKEWGGWKGDKEVNKIKVMVKAVLYKFSQNKKLLHAITNVPDDTYFIEDSPRDNIWGIGKYETGSNYLGKILTLVSLFLKGKDCEKISGDLSRMVKLDYKLDDKYKKNFGGSYVKLDDNLYYGIHPNIVKPDIDFDHYVILTEKNEKDIPKGNVKNAVYFPIKDRKALSVKQLDTVVKRILKLDGKVYIACKGGHGRSGMVSAAVWGKKHNKSGDESLKYVLKEWKSQRDMSRLRDKIRKLGSPQTKKQRQVVIDYLDE